MDEWKLELEKTEKQQQERKKLFDKYVADYNAKVAAFNDLVKKSQEETKGYVKQISKSQLEEFEEE
jgi:hypothetical protein